MRQLQLQLPPHLLLLVMRLKALKGPTRVCRRYYSAAVSVLRCARFQHYRLTGAVERCGILGGLLCSACGRKAGAVFWQRSRCPRSRLTPCCCCCVVWWCSAVLCLLCRFPLPLPSSSSVFCPVFCPAVSILRVTSHHYFPLSSLHFRFSANFHGAAINYTMGNGRSLART